MAFICLTPDDWGDVGLRFVDTPSQIKSACAEMRERGIRWRNIHYGDPDTLDTNESKVKLFADSDEVFKTSGL